MATDSRLLKLEGAWQLYARGIPEAAGLIQRAETEKSFYSGACAAMMLVQTILSSNLKMQSKHMLISLLIAEAETGASGFAEICRAQQE